TAREADGRIRTEQFGSGEITNREYGDPRGYLTKIETKLGLSTRQQSTSYTYDPNGNLKTRTDNLPATPLTETFGYDTLDRLTSRSTTLGGSTFTYDEIGNFVSRINTNATGAPTSSLDYSFVSGSSPHSDLMVSGIRYSFDGKGRNTRVGTEWNP